jgi:nucleotide-binding universal stress UspA family protein
VSAASTAYRHVLVGTDGSATAGEAVRHAARLAAACDATLTIVTGFTPDPAGVARAQEEAPEEIKWRITDSAAAEEKVGAAEREARAAGATDVQQRTGSGDPAGVLLDAAEAVGADVIVVGSKGMASPARFILGSVPNKVSHHAPCDVLIVHTVD